MYLCDKNLLYCKMCPNANRVFDVTNKTCYTHGHEISISFQIFRCSQKVRDALAAEALSDCEHNIEDAPSDGIDDSKTVRKMCTHCGAYFGYYTVEHIPIKVTAEQAEKIAVQMDQQKLAYNKTIDYLCGLLKEGLAHTEDKVTAYDATCLIPSEHKLYNELTRWRQDEVRFSKGASSLQRVGVSEARKAVKAHIKSWYKPESTDGFCLPLKTR